MATYTFYWRDGKAQQLKGRNPADAMNQYGYGHGALAALDFYAEGKKQEYTWNGKKWERQGE